jgi:hypothetical protein
MPGGHFGERRPTCQGIGTGEERSDDMSAAGITSPSSMSLVIKRAPGLHRLAISLEHRHDDSVNVRCMFMFEGGSEEINILIEKLDVTQSNTIKFSGFSPKWGSIVVGEYDLKTKEGTAELFM